MTDLRDHLTVAEVAERLGANRQQVNRWIVTGFASAKQRGKRIRLRAVKAGGWRIAPQDVDEFLAARTADGLPDDATGTVPARQQQPQTEAEYRRQEDADLDWCRREGLI